MLPEPIKRGSCNVFSVPRHSVLQCPAVLVGLAGMQAGAINMVNVSSLQLEQVSFSGNNGSQGGAIGIARGGSIYAANSEFYSNLAQNGGAIYALQCVSGCLLGSCCGLPA